MRLSVNKTQKLNGEIMIPGSKSHSIRGIMIASLCNGESTLYNVLDAKDPIAAINACKQLGAEIIEDKDKNKMRIKGFGNKPILDNNDGYNKNNVINNKDEVVKKIYTMNSATTTNLMIGICSLYNKKIKIDGDESIRRRPVQPLLDALIELGIETYTEKNNGCPPLHIKGPMHGGKTTLDCKSSQFISSLMVSCPLINEDTEINITNICEVPYIYMTLRWLDEQNIKYKLSYNSSQPEIIEKIKIYGNQNYKPFEKTIPADWSSAAFPIIAGLVTGSDITLTGLDPDDTQGDKKVVEHLKKMGAEIDVNKNKVIVKGNNSVLKGVEIDLNETPDALPAVSVAACFAEGTTRIINVAHARIKETDRIKVMRDELSKLGAEVKELEDGLEIIGKPKGIGLKSVEHESYHDHRVAMSLAVAGLAIDGETIIKDAECMAVTYPEFIESMKQLGADFSEEE